MSKFSKNEILAPYLFSSIQYIVLGGLLISGNSITYLTFIISTSINFGAYRQFSGLKTQIMLNDKTTNNG